MFTLRHYDDNKVDERVTMAGQSRHFDCRSNKINKREANDFEKKKPEINKANVTDLND